MSLQFGMRFLWWFIPKTRLLSNQNPGITLETIYVVEENKEISLFVVFDL